MSKPPMRFGIFYEHQLPRPWDGGAEQKLISDALDQIELADRLGIDYVWEVEHHFLEEYSHSSASEVFLAAASQRTDRIRLGFGIVAIPPGYQHPARVAEKVAMLDLVSKGRCEFGSGETSSGAELGGFGVDRETKRPSQPANGSSTIIRVTTSSASSHCSRLVARSTPKPSSSAPDDVSPVPNSTRPRETRSSIATFSATRAGCW